MAPRTRRPGQEQPRGLGLQRGVVAPQSLRQRAEALDDPRVVGAGDLREQVEAHPVAQVAPRAVAAVGAPADAAVGEPALDRLPPGEEQGVHDQAAVARRGDAAEARRPRPAEQAHQDGLRLVVSGVREGDDRAPALRQLEKEAEALPPGQFLHGSAAALGGGEAAAEPEVKSQAVAPGQLFDR